MVSDGVDDVPELTFSGTADYHQVPWFRDGENLDGDHGSSDIFAIGFDEDRGILRLSISSTAKRAARLLNYERSEPHDWVLGVTPETAMYLAQALVRAARRMKEFREENG